MYVTDHHGNTLAILVEDEGHECSFKTHPGMRLQVATMNRKRGDIIELHRHEFTQEVLIVIDGCMIVDMFDSNWSFVWTCELTRGDAIYLLAPHRIEFPNDCKLLEVKTGPYLQDDKIYYQPQNGGSHGNSVAPTKPGSNGR